MNPQRTNHMVVHASPFDMFGLVCLSRTWVVAKIAMHPEKKIVSRRDMDIELAA